MTRTVDSFKFDGGMICLEKVTNKNKIIYFVCQYVKIGNVLKEIKHVKTENLATAKNSFKEFVKGV